MSNKIVVVPYTDALPISKSLNIKGIVKVNSNHLKDNLLCGIRNPLYFYHTMYLGLRQSAPKNCVGIVAHDHSLEEFMYLVTSRTRLVNYCKLNHNCKYSAFKAMSKHSDIGYLTNYYMRFVNPIKHTDVETAIQYIRDNFYIYKHETLQPDINIYATNNGISTAIIEKNHTIPTTTYSTKIQTIVKNADEYIYKYFYSTI